MSSSKAFSKIDNCSYLITAIAATYSDSYDQSKSRRKKKEKEVVSK
jgi:hypothetical protein